MSPLTLQLLRRVPLYALGLALLLLVVLALGIVVLFWRRRYLTR